MPMQSKGYNMQNAIKFRIAVTSSHCVVTFLHDGFRESTITMAFRDASELLSQLVNIDSPKV
jgi:hypothetical protein